MIFGAFWTRGRAFLTAFHFLSLVWGIIVEVSPFPCPLTLAEQWLETKAGINPYHGAFLIHYLDSIVYPDLPEWLLIYVGVAICALNLLIYAQRLWLRRSRRALHRT